MQTARHCVSRRLCHSMHVSLGGLSRKLIQTLFAVSLDYIVAVLSATIDASLTSCSVSECCANMSGNRHTPICTETGSLWRDDGALDAICLVVTTIVSKSSPISAASLSPCHPPESLSPVTLCFRFEHLMCCFALCVSTCTFSLHHL